MASPYLLDRSEAVLCIVDIQEKLATRMPDRDKIIAQARMLVLAAQRLEIPILLTEQYPKGLGTTVAELMIVLDQNYSPVEKMCFGCADEPEFLARLKTVRRKQVVLCGLETHICVLQTCLALLDRGCRVHVVSDAVSSRQPEHREIALEQMRHAGAVITCAEAAIFQLLGRAGTPEFSDLLHLFK